MNTLLDTMGYFGFIFLELVILFLSISTAVALLMQSVPAAKFTRLLAGRGGYVMGAFLGALTPFCACSTIPLTLGLLQAGVAIGPTLTFVLVSPLLNPIIIGMVWTMIGSKACLIYFIVCFLAAMAGGWLMSRLHAERFLRHGSGRASADSDSAAAPGMAARLPFRSRLRQAFLVAYADLQGVLAYLIIGTAIGAAIYGYVPQEWVLKLAGPENRLAVPAAALIGIPLYIRAESAIPIGLALAQKGMSLGAVMALIIGGAGMAIPEMSMLLSIFKGRIVAAIVGLVFLTAVTGGYAFNLFF